MLTDRLVTRAHIGGDSPRARLVHVPYVSEQLARVLRCETPFTSPRHDGSPRTRALKPSGMPMPTATTCVEHDAFAMPADAVRDAHPSSRLARVRVRVRPEDLLSLIHI